MDFAFPDVVNLMFSPTAGGITLGAGSIWLLVFLARHVAAPMSRWRAPWGGIGLWLSGPSGGFWLGGILAGSAALLKAAAAGPMDGSAWASVVIAWGAAMGINCAAKRAPGLAHIERGRKRRAGLATLALALGLTLTSTSALARDWTPVFSEPPRTAAPAHGSVLDGLSLGVAVGWDFGDLRGLALDPIGVVHLADFSGWTISAGISGGLLRALRDAASGPFDAQKLSGGLGVCLLFPAPPGAALRAGLELLMAGDLSGDLGSGFRLVLFL